MTLDIHYEKHAGLDVKYVRGEDNKPAVVLAKGLGIPGKEFGRMFLLQKLGFNVVYAPYRGTWGSEGEFLSNDVGALSVTQDVSDMIDFAIEQFGDREVYLIGECFGASQSLVAGAQSGNVTRIFTFGGMIYTSNRFSNSLYAANPNDKAVELGSELAGRKGTRGQGNWFPGYNGFDFQVWLKMVAGQTDLNPYKHLDSLGEKRVLLMHPERDRLVASSRSVHFHTSLSSYIHRNGKDGRTELSLVPKGHKDGFGETELAKLVSFFSSQNIPSAREALQSGLEELATNTTIVERSKGEPFSVPFYDLVVEQIRMFIAANLLHDNPLEEILWQAF